MALSDVAVKAAKIPPEKKQIKLADSGGLYLLVNKSGKYWRYDYSFADKRKTLSIGAFPAVPLAGRIDKKNRDEHGHPLYIKGARDLRDDAKKLIKQGIDPSQKKQKERIAHVALSNLKNAQEAADANTLEFVARQWFKVRKPEWEESHSKRLIGRLERYVFPTLGQIPVAKLTRRQVAETLTSIADLGVHDTAKRIAQMIRNILDYACDKGLIESVPMGSTKSLLPTPKVTPMPAITEPKRIGEFLRAIDAYQGTFVVCCALKLLPYLAVRSGEFRMAEWPEFNLDSALWTIPANHRKLPKTEKENPDNVHLVPLPSQAVSIFRELFALTGHGKHVFPSSRGDARPMSENTINAAIHTMGFKGEMVGHGVRAMFSSSLNEQGFNPDAVERQLAHKEGDSVRGAYNRAEYLSERTTMMQHWADYLDGLREGATIIPIHSKKQHE